MRAEIKVQTEFLVGSRTLLGFHEVRRLQETVVRDLHCSIFLKEYNGHQLLTYEYFYEDGKSVFCVHAISNKKQHIVFLDCLPTFDEVVTKWGPDSPDPTGLKSKIFKKIGISLVVVALRELLKGALSQGRYTQRTSTQALLIVSKGLSIRLPFYFFNRNYEAYSLDDRVSFNSGALHGAASVVGLSVADLTNTPASQNITSGIEGQVTDENGAAIANATVEVSDTRTGQTRSVTTGSNGQFRATSLVPGGPYTVTARAAGFEGQTVENQFINLKGNTNFTFELASGSNENVIVVTGARANVSQLAVGPGPTFNTETLEGFPSISRDVRDIVRLDPRVSLDRSNEVDRISCLGGNDRSNTFTVDGIDQADVFGLNGTPFAARNSLPLPFGAIRGTSVEFAPFDEEYSDFTGCAINVVAQSNEKKFHRSGLVIFRNEGLQGDSIHGANFASETEQGSSWGAALSGAIIPDRLLFFVSYEETDLGGYLRSLYEANVRDFGRSGAFLPHQLCLKMTYERLDETNVETDYYSVRLYFEWIDSLSTEACLSRAEVSVVQGPIRGGEAQSANPLVRLTVGTQVSNGNGGLKNGVLSKGPGIFRSDGGLNLSALGEGLRRGKSFVSDSVESVFGLFDDLSKEEDDSLNILLRYQNAKTGTSDRWTVFCAGPNSTEKLLFDDKKNQREIQLSDAELSFLYATLFPNYNGSQPVSTRQVSENTPCLAVLSGSKHSDKVHSFSVKNEDYLRELFDLDALANPNTSVVTSTLCAELTQQDGSKEPRTEELISCP
ncbi:hypothetical protein A8B75_19135 [Sphingomonadales bacterium EhC05]|nr:hypothetical protein A8B75_19135 [Sphingomonadales bacterium EhC05]